MRAKYQLCSAPLLHLLGLSAQPLLPTLIRVYVQNSSDFSSKFAAL